MVASRYGALLSFTLLACAPAGEAPEEAISTSTASSSELRVAAAAENPGPMEACTITPETLYPEPPREGLVEYCTNLYLSGTEDSVRCGRAITDELRTAAASSDSVEVLTMAAMNEYRRLRPELGAPSWTPANAIADLAVTGQRKFSDFRIRLPSIASVQSALSARLAVTFPAHTRSSADMLAAATSVTTRAYRVAWALRGPPSYRAANRASLGWIAVSAEHDSPHRPVNVPVTRWPQRDIALSVATPTGSLVVRTRYSIAGLTEPAQTFAVGRLPFEPTLTLPDDARVVLYVHGHSSRLEESLDLAEAMLVEGARRNENVVVVAVDLPSNGYATMLDHRTVAPSAASSYPDGFPVLAFLDQFLITFVETLNPVVPIRDRMAAVVGGSLGGNLGLRLEARRPHWLTKVVAWSPGSVWTTWSGGHGVIGEGVRITRDRYNEGEGSNTRIDYFQQVFRGFGPFRIQSAQAPRWYRDGWPCKNAFMLGAVRDRQEIYNSNFRRWHWRVAHEQLLFSHQDNVAALGTQTLLLAGQDDNAYPEHIFDWTKNLAGRMGATQGDTGFLATTGHSIHNERPRLLARRVLDFATQHLPRSMNWCRHVGATIHTGDFDGDRLDDLLCHTVPGSGWIDLDLASNGIGNENDRQTGFPWCSHAGARLLVADVTGDGRDELVCHTTPGGGLHLNYADAAANFPAAAWPAPAFCAGIVQTLRVGDADGDGDDDLLCHDLSTGRTTVRRATGATYPSGSDLVGGSPFFCTAAGSSLFIGDVNGDGRDDLVCHSSTTGRVQVDLSTGLGTFYGGIDFSSTTGWCYHATTRTMLDDVDGDGRDDLLCLARSTGIIDTMFAMPTGAFPMFSGTSRDFNFCQTDSTRLVSGHFFRFSADGAPRGASLVCQDTTTRGGTLLPTAY